MTLVGRGAAGPACLLAAALSKRAAGVDADLGGFDPGRDASWRRHFDTPCFRSAGGLAAAFALLAGRPADLRGAHPQVEALAARYNR